MRTPVSSSTPVRLEGRDRELGVLHDHLSAALAQRGRLVLIGGEAGIGKTALAETICHEAVAHGGLVLIGRSYDLNETPPYGPWIELFAQYEPSDALPLPDAFAKPGTVGEVTSQAALFQQVLDFTRAVTEQRPMLLLLDDLHWADLASLDLLRFFARALAALRVLLVATYRADELTRRHPLYTLLPVLVREASATRIDLRPLRSEDIAVLVRARYHLPDTDATQLVTYLNDRSEGNPFFLGELLRTLEEEDVLRQTEDGWSLGVLAGVQVPSLLRQVIDGRLARLGEEAQSLLMVAAVIGQDVPFDVWTLVSESDEAVLLDTVEQAMAAHLVDATLDGTGFRFVHALIREALYESVLPLRRRALHRRAGDVLAALPHADPDSVAFHFQRAGDERAAQWLVRAGARAQAAYAWVTAAQRFEAALLLMERTDTDAEDRGWLMLRLSRLLRYTEGAKARAFADEALALAQSTDMGTLAAFARFQRGMLALFAGDVAGGLPELEAGAEALSALSATERVDYAAHAVDLTVTSPVPEVRGTVVLWRANTGRFHTARELGEHLIAVVAEDGEEAVQAVRDGYHGLAYAYAALGMPDEAARMYRRAHDVFLRGGHRLPASQASWQEAITVVLPYWTEDLVGRRRLLEQAEAELARASGALPVMVPPRFVWLPLLVLEGQWEEAERLAAAGRIDGPTSYWVFGLQHVALLARLRGDPDRAWRAVSEVLPLGSATALGSLAYFDVAVAMEQVVVSLALDAGDHVRAKEWLDALDRWMAWAGTVRGQSEKEALWAKYFRHVGDEDAARAYAQRALTHAAEPRQPLALLAAHRLLGVLDTAAARYEDAASHLDESLRLVDACAAPYERALTLLALAELRVATGDKAAVVAALDEARAICVPLGAKPALACADALAARLSHEPVRTAQYPGGLSAREVEVLCLVAQGMTDAQVAEHLFLSPRTVGQHLRNIYNKLGVSTRTAATRFAIEHHFT